MKKLWIIPLIFLLGCTPGKNAAMEEALAFRAALQGAGGCSFIAEITADYEEALYKFTLDCDTDENGTLTFTVQKPETISGITGTVSGPEGTLTFDGQALGFPTLAEGRLSPVSGPYTVAESWRSGYLSLAGYEEDQLRITVDTDFQTNPLRVDTWIEKNIPIFSEVCYNGKRVLTVSISEFQYHT